MARQLAGGVINEVAALSFTLERAPGLSIIAGKIRKAWTGTAFDPSDRSKKLHEKLLSSAWRKNNTDRSRETLPVCE